MFEGEGHVQAVETPTGFAERILWAAVRAPEARSPLAARTIAGILGLLAAEGADDVVATLLAPVPGGRATFEVVTGTPSHDPAGTNGQDVLMDAPLTHLDVGRALHEASRLTNAGPGRVTVIAVGPDGLRRMVLERDPAEPFRFVYPDASAFRGLDSAVADAVERWQQRLEVPPAAVAAGRNSLALDLVEGAAIAEPAPVLAAAAAPLDSQALAEVVRDALADVMVEVDMVAVEQMVSDALRTALDTADPQPTQPAGEPPGGWPGQASLVAAAEQFHVVLESFNDRIRAGSRSLQSLADELAAQERVTALYTDQLAKSVHASIERLSRHIDTRLDELSRGSTLRRDREPRD
jgi:hypothetical protein